jgi:chitin disaccharide deacetylase
MSRLIVNADDLGISRGTNRAIAECFSRGIVTSASLLVNMPAWEDAVRTAREQPALQIGLHVCLTSGRSVLPARQVPLLVDDGRRFAHSFLGLWRLLRSPQREAALTQLAAEIEAQWERARRSQLRLGHLDSHQHVHMLPDLFPVVADLARKAGVTIRVADEPWQLAALAVGPRSIEKVASGLIKATLLRWCTRRNARLAAGLRRSAACFGIMHSGRMTRDVLRHLIGTLPEGLSELITHPSLEAEPDPQAALSDDDRDFLASPCRRQEYEALLDPLVHQSLDRAGTQLLRRRAAA